MLTQFVKKNELNFLIRNSADELVQYYRFDKS